MKISFKKDIFSNEDMERAKTVLEKTLLEPFHFLYDGESQIATVSFRDLSIKMGKYQFKKGISRKIILDKSLSLKNGSYYSLVVEEAFVFAPAVIFVKGMTLNEDGILSQRWDNFICKRIIRWNNLSASELFCYKYKITSYNSPLLSENSESFKMEVNPEVFSDEEKAIYSQMAKRLERQKLLQEKISSLGEIHNIPYNGVLYVCKMKISTNYEVDYHQFRVSPEQFKRKETLSVCPISTYKGYVLYEKKLKAGAFNISGEKIFPKIVEIIFGKMNISDGVYDSTRNKINYHYDRHWGGGSWTEKEKYSYRSAYCSVKVVTELGVFENQLSWEEEV